MNERDATSDDDPFLWSLPLARLEGSNVTSPQHFVPSKLYALAPSTVSSRFRRLSLRPVRLGSPPSFACFNLLRLAITIRTFVYKSPFDFLRVIFLNPREGKEDPVPFN